MKKFAILFIFSIILLSNTHTALVAPTEKDNTINMRKPAVYELTMVEHNSPGSIVNQTEPSTKGSMEGGNLCAWGEETQSRSEIIDHENKSTIITNYNKHDQSSDETEISSQISPSKLAFTNQTVSEENRQHMIPDEAIRLRILANSDSPTDQHIKKIIRNRVNEHIQNKVALVDKIETARTVIEEAIPTLETIIAETLAEYNEQYSFNVAFETDVPFPLKTYGPYVYPAGDYEAILITLGDGIGENWWCVLFPPLCFIDFFNSTAAVDTDETSDDDLTDEPLNLDGENSDEDVEVRFFLLDLFNFS